MKQWYLVQDVRWCHDCNNCLMSCKDEFVGNDWPGYTKPQPRHGHRWVNVLRRERGRYARNDYIYLATTCQHCEDAPCEAAGKGAVYRREDGIVMIDQEKAKGNKDLVDSCPYGAIYYNEEEDVAQKCTMCSHLLDDPDWTPGVPRCVHSCPTESLKAFYIEPEEMEAMIESENLEVFHPEYGTKPHVFYKNLFMFTKNFVAGGVTKNKNGVDDCVENATAILKDAKGNIVEVQKTNFFGDFKFDGLDDGDYVLELNVEGEEKKIDVKIEGKSLNLDYIAF
ncbi:4Fe-4S dicluster domain-containing protein [Eubacterium oxidoreducens]|uniref:Fe-S-cluster-containing dehydrogenase component n=1 Tax=Eubacterium oxidoreducens TaxID=1732 RepID=A0A1G6C0V2_EUBOX|nr:4Fe-4S dicluster domain-containing protein [Eubacterium oxidoreducens]SDB26457.1 Fe-S-cluster-containing dehydrogenase component [Eubacterium oxidoreducens]